MTAPTYDSIILKASWMMDELTATFSVTGYKAVASYLAAPIGALCVLYIVLTGFALVTGYSNKPIQEFKKIVIRIGVVYTFAFSWGNFSGYFVDLLSAVSNGLGTKVMEIIPFNLPILKGQGVNGALQTVLIEAARVGQWVMDKGSFYSPMPWFTGLSIMALGGLVVIIAFIEIISAKFILAVCFCFAPFFFAMTLFDRTRSFFDQWLGTLVGSSFLIIFVSGGVGLCVHLMHFVLGEHFLSHAAGVTFTDWLPLALFAVLSVKVLTKLAGIGQHIGGACHSSGSSAMVGGMIGGALGASKSGASMSKNLAGGGLRALSNITPQGRIAQMGAKLANSMAQGGQAVKAIQGRMRGQHNSSRHGSITRTFKD